MCFLCVKKFSTHMNEWMNHLHMPWIICLWRLQRIWNGEILYQIWYFHIPLKKLVWKLTVFLLCYFITYIGLTVAPNNIGSLKIYESHCIREVTGWKIKESAIHFEERKCTFHANNLIFHTKCANGYSGNKITP